MHGDIEMAVGSELDISVVVCAYALERWADLVAAINSLQRQTQAPAEIIVVVDHNAVMLQRVRGQFPEIKAVANHHQHGLSGARNTGVGAARGDIVAFLDDDAVAAEDWLARLRHGYHDPLVQGVGGAVLPRWEGGRRPNWFPVEFNWVVGCSYRGMPTRTAAVRNLIGANMSYRREALLTVGCFREGIGRVGKRPLGCEETELSIRVLKRAPGSLVLYDPQAKVEHRVPRTRQTVRYFFSRCYAEGLSKALVARLVGTASGLSAERTYTFRTLPRGVIAGLSAGLRGDLAGFARAAAIASGLATTTVGYLVGRLRPAMAR